MEKGVELGDGPSGPVPTLCCNRNGTGLILHCIAAVRPRCKNLVGETPIVLSLVRG